MANKSLAIDKFIKAQKIGGLFEVDLKWIYTSWVIVAVAFALIFLQPFGLNEVDGLKRISYWGLISAIGYCLYGTTFILGGKLLKKASFEFSYPIPIIVCCLVASILMAFVVVIASSVFFDLQAPYSEQFFTALPQTLTIGVILLVVATAIDYVMIQNKRMQHDQLEEAMNKQAIDTFLQNVPVNMRGELLCIKAEDHYLRVYTDKGQHLLLMRFKDAMENLEEAFGHQVHRSWWISDSAVVEAVREGRNTSLLLKNDIHVPISRKFLPEVKKHNLLK